MSRKDIANQIGLTPAAVTMLCNDMMEAHMILEKGEMKEQKRAGRKKGACGISIMILST